MTTTDDYQAMPIPPRPDRLTSSEGAERALVNTCPDLAQTEDPFREVDLLPLGIDEPLSVIARDLQARSSGSIPNLAAEPIPLSPPRDPMLQAKLDRFRAMRRLAYRHDGLLNFRAESFYRQIHFMEDFEDDYTEFVDFHELYPYYQSMSLNQLRSYFTWRTKVRQGQIQETSLSYAYLYIYECLNLIAADNPTDGLANLLSFWRVYRSYEASIDNYVLPWLKDYFIYYAVHLEQNFMNFVREQALEDKYPELFIFTSDQDNSLDVFSAFGGYPIKRSIFYSEDTKDDLRLCFYDLLTIVREAFMRKGMVFEEHLLYKDKNNEQGDSIWIPFNRALFKIVGDQTDRQVQLSPIEQYNCRQGNWSYQPSIPLKEGVGMVAYMLKEMESQFRLAEKFKYRLRGDFTRTTSAGRKLLKRVGIDLPYLIKDTVNAYLKRKNRIELEILPLNLERIRAEAIEVQDKLIIPDAKAAEQTEAAINDLEEPMQTAAEKDKNEPNPASPWSMLADRLTSGERNVLKLMLIGEDPQAYIRSLGIMPEVFFDSINQKAFDSIGDAIIGLDEAALVYEDYLTELKEMVGLC